MQYIQYNILPNVIYVLSTNKIYIHDELYINYRKYIYHDVSSYVKALLADYAKGFCNKMATNQAILITVLFV